MNAGFSGSGVRNFLPVFVDVAKKVRHLAETLETGSLPEQMISEWEIACSPDSSVRVNIGKTLDHATLDIICDGNYGFFLLFSPQ
jgi:hypothetical protein